MGRLRTMYVFAWFDSQNYLLTISRQLSDDSDLDLQRQAEIEAENAYQEALRKHEEMEFREARDSLVRAAQNTINDGYSSMPMGYSRRTHVGYSASTRIRV